MLNDAQVLSQLLWDINSSKKKPLEIIRSFYNSLISPDSNISVSIQTLIDYIKEPLLCVINCDEEMPEMYLKYCHSVPKWPYGAFLAALIDVMEQDSMWADSWRKLTATQQQDKAKLYSDVDIEKLYAENIIADLRPAIDGHKKIIHDYYRMRWERESFMMKDHYLINLKGMSSSSPIIYNNTFGTHLRGGGFYFRWNMFGVVVDPGLSFVTNMHEYGLSINDVNAVIITHDHLDHKGDMALLDDLEYQIKKSKSIQWYVCAELNGALEAPTQVVNRGEHLKISDSIDFCATETRHMKDPLDDSKYITTTFGCVFTLNSYVAPGDKCIPKRIIGYTSDTTYWDGMEKDYDKVDLLIANISSVKANDLMMKPQNDLHLGFYGCMKMLLGFTQAPQIFMLSEFWNGIEDIRFPVAKQLWRMALRKKLRTSVLPAEIGMEIDLDCLGVKCSFCGAPARAVSLIKSSVEFGKLRYVCDNCIITPERYNKI